MEEQKPLDVVLRRMSSPENVHAISSLSIPSLEKRNDGLTIHIPPSLMPGSIRTIPKPMETNQRRALSPLPEEQEKTKKKNNEQEKMSSSIPRRVSFHDEKGAKDDPEMRMFNMKVYYSEMAIDGELKTYPETKMASIISPLLANRSNFVSSIRKKLLPFGVNPHTRLTLTAIPRVPDDRDCSISRWMKKYDGAAIVVTPEDEEDSLYRQLVTLKGQPATRNPLYRSEPDAPPIDDLPESPDLVKSRSQMVQRRPEPGSNRRRLNTTSGSTLAPSETVVGSRRGKGKKPTTTRGNGYAGPGNPGSPTPPKSEGSGPGSFPTMQEVVDAHRHELEGLQEKLSQATSQLMSLEKEHATAIQGVVESHRQELGKLEQKLLEATSQLTYVEEEHSSKDSTIQLLQQKLLEATSQLTHLKQEHSSKDSTIQLLQQKLEESNLRINEVEQTLNFTTTQSYQARLRDVYRRMFLGCVRKKLRAKLMAWFKSPPSPVDYLLVSYDKVLETCAEMEEVEKHVGLSLEDLKLTEEDASKARPGIHDNERIHIGIYAEMVHSQQAEHLPAYRNLFFFLYNQEPQTVLDNLIKTWT